MKLLKTFKRHRLLPFFGIILGLTIIFSSQAKAMITIKPGPSDTVVPPPSYKIDIWDPAVYQAPEMNQQSFANETMMAVSASIADQILGCVNCPEEYRGLGAVHDLSNLIAGMYTNPPASSVEYFADLGENLGIAKPAYAQGIGFTGLHPVLDLWRIFRNIAYLFFVIIFVIVGFAIMFRLKIDPQTVISIQSALPKIIMALILVTFSYAIAGLLIDLIYVFISLLLALLRPEGVTIDLSRNVFQIASDMFGGLGGVATNLGSQIDALVSSLFSGLGGQILGFGIGVLATAVFAVAIAFSLFRLFFSLLISYISIIVGVIFSPLVLMLEAVPGQRGLGNWIRLMLSNIIVFPVTAGVLAIAAKLTEGATEWAARGEIWVAPFLGTGTTGAYIPTLIGAGMLLLAPSIVDGVKKAIGAPGVAGMAAGIVAPIAGAAGVVAAPPRALWGYWAAPTLEEARKLRGERLRRRLPGWMGGGERRGGELAGGG